MTVDLDLNFFLSAMSGQIQTEVERQLDKALVS
ncbi:putative polyhydroxyalkanoic acid system protein [Paucimonas lemoignei]|nr:putative polyhydroxyalkanoic acid system protein [Paucimonas lemoignei]